VSSTSGAFVTVVFCGDGTIVIASALVGAGHVNAVCAVDVRPDEPKLLGVVEADDGFVAWAPLVHNELDVSTH
jgi:hypothetical protein